VSIEPALEWPQRGGDQLGFSDLKYCFFRKLGVNVVLNRINCQ